MTEASEHNVTPRDRVAKGTVSHVNGFTTLRSAAGVRLRPSAHALLEWICLRSGRYGCAFGHITTIARELGVDRRSVQRAYRTLEAKGLVRVAPVSRGETLPTGRRALNHLIIFYPTPRNSCDTISCDRAAVSCDRSVHAEGGLSPFCDQRDLEEVDDRFHTNRAAEINADSPVGETVRVVAESWRRKCAPELAHTPESAQVLLEWSILIAERVRDGFSRATLLCAIDGALQSRHNRERGRAGRSISAIFGTADRVRALAEVGAPSAFRAERPPERRAEVLSIEEMRRRAHETLAALQPPTHEKAEDDHDRIAQPAE